MDNYQESPARIEPCLLDAIKPEILNLVAQIAGATHALGAGLHPKSAEGLADLVRVMNCYYSNLIEGHNTTPREIERALHDQMDVVEDRRNLQIEARAHIRLQREIDRLYADGDLPEPTSIEFIRWLHRAFYEGAPDAMLRIEGAGRVLRMVPGEFRSRPEEQVSVGRHLPPGSDRVEAFMAHFEWRYHTVGIGMGEQITAIPAAHHRLNYIHPFLDGNGRVSRLMSHAMALNAGIGAHGLWSVSRGLARGLTSRGEYKEMMDCADSPRQGDLDGRGNLSRRALTDFTEWFLKVCLDQVTFMAEMFAFSTLEDRLHAYVEMRGIKPEAFYLLQHALQRGDLPRGDAARVTGMGERSARQTLRALLDAGILGSETPKGPVSLRFPLDAVEILFPSLFPQI